MGIAQGIKSAIKSNADAGHSNMFLKPFMIRKGSDMSFSSKNTQAAWKDMREADKVVSQQKERIADAKAEVQKHTDAGDANAAKKAERKVNSLEGRMGGLQDTAATQSKAFGETAWNYAKTPMNYMMAKDYAGKDGRAMAIAARGAGAGAAWMGVNMAGRMATGGGFTYNNTGERDIAGIPFI